MASDLAFAFLLGLGTFFSPCAVALVPSYLAYFASRTPGQGGPWASAWAAFRVALWASAGILATFAVLATALYLVRERFDVASTRLFATFSWLGALVGLAFVALGILVVLGRAPSLTIRATATLPRTRWAMAAWGVLFAAGSMGCSLPLTLAILARVLAEPAQGPATILAYAAGLSIVLLAASPVLGFLEQRAGRVLARATRPIQVVSGVFLVLAGTFVTVYYLRALW